MRRKMMHSSCNIEELKHFIKTSKPGDLFIYYEGWYLSDTVIGRELKKLTYNYATRGIVYLVQKRKAYEYFQYILIKASLTPVYSLVPLPVDRLNELIKERGAIYGSQN